MDPADILCCHLGKNFASRVRYTERGSYGLYKLCLNGLRKMRLIFLSFQVLYHFKCVYSVSKIAYFTIDAYFLLTRIFF